MKQVFISLIFISLFFVPMVNGQIPQTIGYQGVLLHADGKPTPDGNYQLSFRIYDAATGGSELWAEIQTIAVANGIFSTNLGLVKPLALPFDRPYWLGLTIGDGQEATPRTAFTATAYSLNAQNIVDGAVTSNKIPANQVVKSLNGLRDQVILAAGENIAITVSRDTIRIRSTVVANAGDITGVTAGTGLSGGGLSGDVALALNTVFTDAAYVNENQANAITGEMLQNGTVANIDLANNSISQEKIADNSITSAKILDGQVNTADVASNSITSAQIQDGQVANVDLANNAVTAAKIAPANAVKSLNTLRDDIILAAGANVTLTTTGNTIAIAAASSGDGFSLDAADGNPKDAVYVNIDGNVGVGTTTPMERLDVNGNATFNGEVTAAITAGSYLKMRSSANQSLIATNDLFVRYGDTAGSGGLIFREAGQERFRILAGGNVGIGTANPGEKLSVTGVVESRSGGFKFPDGTVQNTAAVKGGDGFSLDADDGDPIDALYVDAVGNVGIGLKTPGNKLSVLGTVESLTGGFKFPDGTVQTTAVSASGIGGTGTLNYLAKFTGSNTLGNSLIFERDASIAIGSTTPDANALVKAEGTSLRPVGILGIGHFGSTNVRPIGIQAGVETANLALNGYGFYSYLESAKNPNITYLTTGSFNIEVNEPVNARAVHVGMSGDLMDATDYALEIHADSPGYAIYSPFTGAVYFGGTVNVAGTMVESAAATRIDHPLDPENKYLNHAFVESPDMTNFYNGNVVLDENGAAWVSLPAWFEAINRDFRYQLTAIGAPGPNLYIAEEISANRFKIAGGSAGMKVSWQVTGIRQDPYAEKNRIAVEEQKNATERGFYLHPELYGKSREMGITWGRDPDGMKASQAGELK